MAMSNVGMSASDYAFGAAFVIYSCGPNIAVGAVGVVGGLSIYTAKRVQAAVQERGLASMAAGEERAVLQSKVTRAKDEADRAISIVAVSALNAIPIIGPYAAFAAVFSNRCC
jgi:hypothetical protein